MKVKQLIGFYFMLVILASFIAIFFGCGKTGKKPIEVIGVKAEAHIGEKMESVVKVDKATGVEKAEIEAKGVDLSKKTDESIKAGGNVEKTQINESGMIKFIFEKVMDNVKYIIGGLFAFILSIFAGIRMMLNSQSKAYNKIIDTLMKHISENEKREDALLHKIKPSVN